MSEAGQIAELCDDRDRSDEVKATQAHQRLDHRSHAPLGALLAQGLGYPLQTLMRFGYHLAILIEGDLLGGMIKAHLRQLSLVRRRPCVAVIGAAMPQHHGLQLLSGPKTRSNRIFSSSGQIPHRLIAAVRQDNLRQVTRARLTRQQQRITPIRLDRLARGGMRNMRRRNHLAAPALSVQVARPAITAGPSLVHYQRGAAHALLARQNLTHLGQVAGGGADELRCTTPRWGNRNSHGVLVNIQSNIGSDSLVHGLSPARLSSTIPSGPLHVARRTQLRNPRYGRQTPSSGHSNIPRAPMLRATGHQV